jgi:hypothetical protein
MERHGNIQQFQSDGRSLFTVLPVERLKNPLVSPLTRARIELKVGILLPGLLQSHTLQFPKIFLELGKRFRVHVQLEHLDQGVLDQRGDRSPIRKMLVLLHLFHQLAGTAATPEAVIRLPVELNPPAT